MEKRFAVRDRPSKSRSKLIQQKRVGRGAIERRARIEGIIPEKFEELPMKIIRAGGRDSRELAARGSVLRIGAKILRLHLEFLDGIKRNIQTHILSLFLVINGGRINAVESQVVVVQSVACKPNRPLITGAIVDGAWRERRQRSPIPAVNG